MNRRHLSVFTLPVLVAALGYFVDIYDLLLFSIIRVPSLKDLGLNDSEVLTQGEFILKLQMTGLLLGGIIWGVMGDKRGRLSVLFGSILLYSVANIINGFVHTPTQYAWVRFVAGLGLAGELGAGITLVSELTAKENRGIATSLVAGLGLTGAVVAFFIKENFDWRVCYFIGGGLGFLLLLLRISIFESGIYTELRKLPVKRGNFFMLFSSKERFKKYLLSILLGIPTWYVIGILITFSKEFAADMHISGTIDTGKAVMYSYAAISIGDILIGVLSQLLKSRKSALYIFYAITAIFTILFFTIQYNGTPERMYWICAGLGLGAGFWAIFVTMGAEQFGTNLRATAATTIPNMVRGLLPLMLILFEFTRNLVNDYVKGAWITGIIVFAIGITSVIFTRETFGKDLNFVEE